ncbi:MAG: ABC transporter permease [Candidatus Acidiferrales bacterium]
MDTLWQDLRYSLRMLAKSPGFALIAILTLALGIGANAALFSVVNGVILNPLPFSDPDRLISVYQKSKDFTTASDTFPNFLDWQRQNHTLTALAGYREMDLSLTGRGQPERLHGQQVSAEFFPLLGIPPIIGRNFRPEEDQVGAAPVALISEGYWKSKFGSSPDVLGKSLMLSGTPYTVIGVINGRVPMFSVMDVFIPIGQWNDPTFRDRSVGMGMNAVARLKPGVAFAQANSDLNQIAQNLAKAYPDSNNGIGITTVPLKKDIVGDVQPILFVLLGAVGFVLLIACANVANLLLARSTGRTREFAIRVALGAKQSRVIRQLLTESVLLAVAGGALGLAIAKWGTQAVLAALPAALPRADNIRVESRVLLFTLAVSILVGILFGLVPALKTANPDLHDTLKEGGRSSTAARHRTQSVFVVIEMAMAVVLLIGAGLMIRSLAALWGINPGFDTRNVLTFNLAPSPNQMMSPQQTRAAFRAVAAKFASVPGVLAVSELAGSLPMEGDSELPFWLEGKPKPANLQDMPFALFYAVQPGYLKAMGTPLLRGRFLSDQDDERSPAVIAIDEEFAREYFPGEDPVGKRINLSLVDTQPEIIGIVRHVSHFGLGDTAHKSLQCQFYMPITQVPDKFLPLFSGGISMVVRTSADPKSFIPAIRAASAEMDINQVPYDFFPMAQIVSDSIASKRFAMLLLAVFAALALVLSAIGIYGVISYLTAQRTHEIGIRMALGAQPGDVLRMVLRRGMAVSLAGVFIGIGAAYGLTRLMLNMIYGVRPSDLLTYSGVAVLLSLVAFAACYVPARRATRVDPIVALRYE